MEKKETEKPEKEFVRLNPLNDYLFKQYMGTEECKICLTSFVNAVFMYRNDKHPDLVLTDKIEIHMLELPKFFASTEFDINNPLHRWLKFFNKEISEEELKELVEMDEAILTAEKRMERAMADMAELRKYHAAEDAKREYISAINYATSKGLVEGEAKGEARFSKLIMRLLEENRQEEVMNVSKDVELRKKYYEEFNI